MYDLLEEINEAVKASDYGVLLENEIKAYQKRYQQYLAKVRKSALSEKEFLKKKGSLKDQNLETY
jgi:uncharacterized protein YnzC (UPF0291/DUF896 family)